MKKQSTMVGHPAQILALDVEAAIVKTLAVIGQSKLRHLLPPVVRGTGWHCRAEADCVQPF